MTCRVDGCDRPLSCKGMCAIHYRRSRKHGSPLAHVPIGQLPSRPPLRRGEVCDIEGCDREIQRRNWCLAHYRRWLRSGDPGPPEIAARTPTRINGECLTCVDACHLIGLGESVELTAARLDMTADRLLRHLRRHGHRELSDQLSPVGEEPIMQVDDMTVPPVPPVPAEVAQAARDCLARRCHDADVLADMLGLAG